jgi:hypothetical protein
MDDSVCLLVCCINVDRLFNAPVAPTSADEMPGESLLIEDRFAEVSGLASIHLHLTDDLVDDVV